MGSQQARLRHSKAAVRAFIRINFSDERLHEVYAFNSDGHMRYTGPCLLHVTVADSRLASKDNLYRGYALPGGWEAEQGYRLLGDPWLGLSERAEAVRQRRLSAILRAEMRRRERVLSNHQEEEDLAVSAKP